MPIKQENRNKYPPSWPLISWAIRYLRAAGRCEWIDDQGERCARIDGQPIPGNPRGSKTVLTVAHLDHNPENCQPVNLRAWCQSHHLRYDATIHAQHAAATRRQRTEAMYDGNLFG